MSPAEIGNTNHVCHFLKIYFYYQFYFVKTHYISTKSTHLISSFFQAKNTVTAVQKESTVTVTIVSVNMDSDRMDTEDVRVIVGSEWRCQCPLYTEQSNVILSCYCYF